MKVLKTLAFDIQEKIRLYEATESIKSEEDFRDYAENKFEEVFGEDLDEDKMNTVIDGILDKYKKSVDKGDWGKIVGVFNKGFVGESLNENIQLDEIPSTFQIDDVILTYNNVWGVATQTIITKQFNGDYVISGIGLQNINIDEFVYASKWGVYSFEGFGFCNLVSFANANHMRVQIVVGIGDKSIILTSNMCDAEGAQSIEVIKI